MPARKISANSAKPASSKPSPPQGNPHHQVGSKKKRPTYDTTSRRMKKAVGGPIAPVRRKGEWELAKERKARIPGTPRTKNSETTPLSPTHAELVEMAHSKAGGASNKQLALEYGLSEQYVDQALKKFYVSSSLGKEILKGVLLENAIATGIHARKKIGELNGMQAVVASGIMTQRFIDLDKHTKAQPESVDVSEVEKAGRFLDQLAAGLSDSVGPEVGQVIDISADIQPG